MGWPGRAPVPSGLIWSGDNKPKGHAMSLKSESKIAVVGIDIGKNSLHPIVSMSVGPLFSGEDGRAARWKPDWRICRRA